MIFRRKKKTLPQPLPQEMKLHGFKYDPVRWNKPRVIKFLGLTLYIGGNPYGRINGGFMGHNEFWLDGYGAQALYERLKEIDSEQ